MRSRKFRGIDEKHLPYTFAKTSRLNEQIAQLSRLSANSNDRVTKHLSVRIFRDDAVLVLELRAIRDHVSHHVFHECVVIAPSPLRPDRM